MGAVDAIEFCRDHGLSEADTSIVKWLVENHLIMSTTAQRKDISDPEVIADFARLVNTQDRLNYIYLLTVADIRATSPSLWNSWKDALLAELYHATTQALEHGLDNPIDQEELITDTQEQAVSFLEEKDLDTSDADQQWERLGNDYFLRHSADEIAWHTRAIIEHGDKTEPLVQLRGKTHRGGTEIFVYTIDMDYLFAIITATIEQLGLNIIDARIITTNDDYALDTFLVLDRDGNPITTTAQQNEIIQSLKEHLEHPEQIPSPSANLARQLKHFPIETKIIFREDKNNDRTEMEVIAGDRPGLLARISRGLMECKVLLQNAKIATFGERAEDIFFITDEYEKPLGVKEQNCLKETITHLLDE